MPFLRHHPRYSKTIATNDWTNNARLAALVPTSDLRDSYDISKPSRGQGQHGLAHSSDTQPRCDVMPPLLRHEP